MYIFTYSRQQQVSGKKLHEFLSGQGRVEVEKLNLTEVNSRDTTYTTSMKLPSSVLQFYIRILIEN
jgi:hypothetical protein